MENPEVLKVIIPAIIGAVGAIVVFVVKDLILYELRERKNRRLQILDRRLSQLYGPLIVALKGGEGMLSNIFHEDMIFEKFMLNLHLLSPELKNIAHEYIKLGRDVRIDEMGIEEKGKAIELSKRFNNILIRESQDLQGQFNGGFWRMRLLMQRLTKRSKGTAQKSAAP